MARTQAPGRAAGGFTARMWRRMTPSISRGFAKSAVPMLPRMAISSPTANPTSSEPAVHPMCRSSAR